MKLNGVDAQEAWEDYKGFLDGMALKLFAANPGAWVHIEQAYKMGYMAGKEAKTPPHAAKQIVASVKIDGKEVAKEVVRRIKKRSKEQMAHDAKLVATILERNGKEMQLNEITAAMNALGADWLPKSASKHVSQAMEEYPQIKKVGYGVFKYER